MPQEAFIVDFLKNNHDAIITTWYEIQLKKMESSNFSTVNQDLKKQMEEFLRLLITANPDTNPLVYGAPSWEDMFLFLERLSVSRNNQGFSPKETAGFILDLRDVVFSLLKDAVDFAWEIKFDLVRKISSITVKLGLHTEEAFIKAKEEIISRQGQELLELSTPVVKLWEGIVALPLIGTLDSNRTQVVMENLLQEIVKTESQIAIIDITGVPMVDTMVAQHLLKTVSAARLMGAECMISGIRPQIAQTMVHLGIGFSDISTKATLAGALKLALERVGFQVVKKG